MLHARSLRLPQGRNIAILGGGTPLQIKSTPPPPENCPAHKSSRKLNSFWNMLMKLHAYFTTFSPAAHFYFLFTLKNHANRKKNNVFENFYPLHKKILPTSNFWFIFPPCTQWGNLQKGMWKTTYLVISLWALNTCVTSPILITARVFETFKNCNKTDTSAAPLNTAPNVTTFSSTNDVDKHLIFALYALEHTHTNTPRLHKYTTANALILMDAHTTRIPHLLHTSTSSALFRTLSTRDCKRVFEMVRLSNSLMLKRRFSAKLPLKRVIRAWCVAQTTSSRNRSAWTRWEVDNT